MQFLIARAVCKFKSVFLYSFFGIVAFWQLQFHLALSIYYLIEASNLCAIMMTLMILNSGINYIQQYQGHQLLFDSIKCTKGNSPQMSTKLGHFFAYHTKCLLSTQSLNQIMGKVLLTSLLANTPVSAFMVISIVHAEIFSKSQILFLILIMLGQTSGIFFIHLMMIHFSLRIHRCGKSLIKANLSNLINRVLSLRMQFKLDHYIFKFHTKRQYGISYGAGNINVTFKAFSRVRLYSTFLIFY